MKDNLTPDARSMDNKILLIMKGERDGEGLTLTPAEVTSFKQMFVAMHQRQVETDEQLILSQGVNRAMIEALARRSLQLTHSEHDDGSVSFDLQNAPQQRAIAEIMN